MCCCLTTNTKKKKKNIFKEQLLPIFKPENQLHNSKHIFQADSYFFLSHFFINFICTHHTAMSHCIYIIILRI